MAWSSLLLLLLRAWVAGVGEGKEARTGVTGDQDGERVMMLVCGGVFRSLTSPVLCSPSQIVKPVRVQGAVVGASEGPTALE